MQNLSVLLILLVFSFSAQAKRAVLELHVKEPLSVYKKASRKSKVISSLDEGDIVVVSPKKYGRFRKVLINMGGGERGPGYVPSYTLKRSKILKRGEIQEKAEDVYANRYGFGLSLVFSGVSQNERSVESGADTYDTSSFQSITQFLQIFADIPLNSKWNLRTGLSIRETNFTGNATVRGVVSSVPSEVKLKQNLIGAFAHLRTYFNNRGKWWWSVGGELAKGTSVDLTVANGTPVVTNSGDYPFFAIVTAGTGWDISITKEIYIIPWVQGGLIVNQKPVMILVEGSAALAYRF